MMPAGGKKPDAARPLPKDSPKGIEVYRPQSTTLSRDSSSTTESRPQTGTTTRCGRAAASTRSPSKIGTPSTAWTTVLSGSPTARPARAADQIAVSLRQRELRHTQFVSWPGRTRNRHLMEGPARTQRRGRPAPQTLRKRVQDLRDSAPLGQQLHVRRGQPERVERGPANRRTREAASAWYACDRSLYLLV
jgi:hypothetical protein